ncbi:histidine kinase [Caldithrix abyssi]|nr:histidine kinase [Caldithrix abyssi]
MRLRQKINTKLVVGILLLLALIIFFTIAVRDEVKMTFFFAAIYIATLGYFIVDRYRQKRKGKELKETSLTAEFDSQKTQINPHLSRRKITKKVIVGILLPLSITISAVANVVGGGHGDEVIGFCFVVTFIALGYFVVDQFIQKRKAREPKNAPLEGKVALPETQINPHLSRRKIYKKLVIGILLLLAPIIIIVIANQSDETEIIVVISSIVAFIIMLVYLVVDRFIQKRKVRKLKEASLRAELDSLKTQINPHFFFNTLNNLYGLTVKKSDMAPEVILKLSDMMRYTIYEGEKDRVALKDEITYLENFIELQKIRFHRKLDIKFEVFIEKVDIKVPPLLFIVLVENAFKHGAQSLTENAFIHMKLMSMDGSVLFKTHNNFEADGTQKTGGIGLKNLQRRLQLLFPDRHTLLLDGTSNGVYKTTLKFNLP